MELLPFLAIAIVIVVTPGVDMALVTRNAVARARVFLGRPRVRRAIDGVSGLVLIGLGARPALEQRR